MFVEELLVLSDHSEDTVDGADEFDVAGHEKGMHLGDFPKDLDEDVNSGYQPSSDGSMIKETTRRSLSHNSSRDQAADQAASKPSSKKSKCKTSSTGEQTEAGQAQSTEGEQAKKKRKRLKKKYAAEAKKEKEAANEATLAAELADTQAGKGRADDIDAEANQGILGAVDLTGDQTEPPPPEALPFTPVVRVGPGQNPVKVTDQGLGRPLIASALMDSIVLLADLNAYMQHPEWAIMNRLTELTYEVNVIRATTFRKTSYYEQHLTNMEERIKTLEEAGRGASELINKQIKHIETLQNSTRALKLEVTELKERATAAETAKASLVCENVALLDAKAKLETALDTFKQEAILEKSSLQKAKFDVEVTLESAKAGLVKARAASKVNYNKGLVWKEHAGRRGDFIADVVSKLGNSFTDEQRIQLEHLAREHKLNLNSLKEKSVKRRQLAQAKASKAIDVVSSSQGSNEQELSDVSVAPKP